MIGFVEDHGDRVTTRGASPSGRSCRSRFPRFTFDEAIERYGSDKPDLRFGMELVDLAPVLVDADGTPASGFRVFDEALAAGGRVKAIVAPGMARRAAPRDRRADRARPAVRGEGPGLPRRSSRTARCAARSPSSSATTASARSSSGPGATGRPDPHRRRHADVTADVLGRLRVELGDRLGLADPNVLAYVWVNRFPMYQWDAENGRWDATHNPFSGVLPEDEALLVTASGDPDRPSPETRPAVPGRSSTTWRSTAGSSAAARSGSTAATCSSGRFQLQGHSLRGDAREVRGGPRRVRLRRAAARRDRASASTAGRRCSPTRPTSARSWPSPRPSRAPT